MDLRRAVEDDRALLAGVAARLQARTDRHIAYLGLDAATIAAEMIDEDDDWTAVSVVGSSGGSVRGWLMGSVDVDMGRVWWFGPFIEGEEDAGEWVVKADALYGSASSMLPDGVDQEEMAVDARFDLLLDWAPTLGFGRDPGSAVLTLDHAIDPSTLATRQIVPSDSATVGALHDQLFPGTHTTGDALVVGRDDTHVGLVAESDGAVVGYIAVERQPDGDGYIDYLGVEPAHRRRGAGEQLVRAGVTALAELDCRRVSLTVREDNAGARALYRGLGFVEERVLVPLRKGFSIP